MKVTEIHYEKLVNLGNFSHAKGGVVIALDEGDSPIAAFAKARHLVKTQTSEEIHRQEELRPQQPTPEDDRENLDVCTRCEGFGKISDPATQKEVTCDYCNGTGQEIPF